MKTRFNKLTAWVLTLAMLMTFIPSFTLGVSAEETIEAKWGTSVDNLTESGTFAEAIAAAQAADSSIKYIQLQTNIDTDTSFRIDNGTFTIDLNGHNVVSDDYTFSIRNSGTVITIVDEAGGEVSTTDEGCPAVMVRWGAKVIINGGKYKGQFAVNVVDSGSCATITDGEFAGTGGRSVESRGTLVIEGGCFYAGKQTAVYSSGETTIKGGNFTFTESDFGAILYVYGTLDLSAYDDVEGISVTNWTDEKVTPGENTIILPDGYAFYDSDNNQVDILAVNRTYTVGTAQSGGEGDEETTVEAKWGTSEDKLTGSGTLAAAIAEAQTDSSITYIQLQTDIETEGYDINRGTFTIDLKGHNVVSDGYPFSIRNSGTEITIVDDEEGEVSTTNEFCVAVEVSDGAKVIINGGKYKGLFAVNVVDSGSCATIIDGEFTSTGQFSVYSFGTLVIKGGSFDTGTWVAVCSFGETTIKGGSFNAGTQAAVYSSGKTTIKGGSFTEGEYGEFMYAGGTLDLSEYEDVEGISVTNFTDEDVAPGENTIKLPEGYAFYDSDNNPVTTLAANGTYTVGTAQSGGEDDEETTDEAKWGTSVDDLTKSGTLADAIAAAQADSSIKYIQLQTDIESEWYLIENGTFIIDLNGHNVVSDGYTFDILDSDTEVTIVNNAGGEVSTTNEFCVAVIVSGGARIIIDGGKYNGGYSAVDVVDSASSATIYNGEFTCTGLDSVYSFGTLVIEGGSFNAGTDTAVYSFGETTIRGGSFTEGEYGEFMYAGGTLDLSEYEDVEDISVTNFTDEDVAPGENTIKLPEGYAFYDSDNNPVTTLAAKGTYTVGTAQSGGEGDEETTVETKWGTSVDNLTKSGTLADAIAAAQAADSSITYIQLQTDIESEEGYIIENGTFIIDLNGHNVVSDGYTFSIQNSDTEITFADDADGEVSTTGDGFSAVKVSDGARIIIDGGKYNGGNSAVGVLDSASSATIYNGEFTCTLYSVYSFGTLVIEGGSFNADAQAAVYSFGKTTINGGSFEKGGAGAIIYADGTLDLSEYEDVEGIRVANWTGSEVIPGDDTIKLPEGYAFYDSDNNQVTTLAANGTYTVGIFETIIAKYDEATKSATVTVKEAGTYSLIFAKYSEDNRLDKVDIVKFTFEKGINTVPQELTDLTLVTGDKIMLWKDMTNLVPLCEAYVVK